MYLLSSVISVGCFRHDYGISSSLKGPGFMTSCVTIGFSNRNLLPGDDDFIPVVCFLLGDSPASDLYLPTFRNTLSVPSSKAFEDGTDRMFRNVGIYKLDAGESPKRKQTTFWTRRKLEIKDFIPVAVYYNNLAAIGLTRGLPYHRTVCEKLVFSVMYALWPKSFLIRGEGGLLFVR